MAAAAAGGGGPSPDILAHDLLARRSTAHRHTGRPSFDIAWMAAAAAGGSGQHGWQLPEAAPLLTHKCLGLLLAGSSPALAYGVEPLGSTQPTLSKGVVSAQRDWLPPPSEASAGLSGSRSRRRRRPLLQHPRAWGLCYSTPRSPSLMACFSTASRAPRECVLPLTGMSISRCRRKRRLARVAAATIREGTPLRHPRARTLCLQETRPPSLVVYPQQRMDACRRRRWQRPA